jgi:hypothetical protein
VRTLDVDYPVQHLTRPLEVRPQLHDSISSASSIMSRSSSSAISQTTASRSHNRYPALIILSISFLLLLRQSFATAVSSRATLSKKSNYVGHEYLWYLLIATPEILAVILYSYPGLVPHWREPRNHDVERSDSDSDTPSCSGNRDAREVL